MRSVQLVIITVLATPLSACQVVKGSGVLKVEDRQVGSFSSVSVADGLNATLTLAPDQAQSVQVSGDDNIVDLVQTTLVNSQLMLTRSSDVTIEPELPLLITISATALDQLVAQSSSTATANALTGENVSISGADSSVIAVGAVNATASAAVSASNSSTVTASGISGAAPVTITESDSASVTLSGQAASLSASLADSATLKAKPLSTGSVTIDATGSVQADVCATASLAATLSDSSEVTYWCNPSSVTQHLNNSATLSAN